jgi:hypothetical protein
MAYVPVTSGFGTTHERGGGDGMLSVILVCLSVCLCIGKEPEMQAAPAL